MDTRGSFYFVKNSYDAKSIVLLEDLDTWWSAEDRLSTVLLPIIMPSADSQEPHIALRPLTWLVTNYVRKRGIAFIRQGVVFNVEEQHAAQLNAYTRKNFDTFRRGPRVYFTVDGTVHESTVAQLNFIRWAHVNGVLEYTQMHKKVIMEDHDVVAKETAARKAQEKTCGKKPKRMQLSKSVDAPCVVIDMQRYELNVDVVFQPSDN